MDPLALTLVLVLLALCAAALFWGWNAQKAGQKQDGQAMQLMQQQLENLRAQLADAVGRQTQTVNQQLNQLTGQVSQRLDAVSQQLMNSQKTVGERLDNAARVVGEVQRSLGDLGQASKRIFEVGKDIAGLQEILSAPKMRGGLGEFFLADLLAQILPARHYTLQHCFKSSAVVDAVIRLGDRLVPVDSKFPLENFRKVVGAATDEERRPLKKKFMADVKKHIEAIAEKYILPDESTYDFALMYVPAENVYYEVIIKDDASEGNSLSEFALKNRVIPVSPNCFYAYLQAIILGLRGFEIEESARVILQNLTRLQGDFQRFRDDFEVLGRHITNTKTKYDDADKRVQRLQDKLISVSQETTPATLPITTTPTEIN